MSQFARKYIQNNAIGQSKIDWGLGAGEVNANEIPVDSSFVPGNYTPTAATIQGHVEGIDVELASFGGPVPWVLADTAAAYVSQVGSDSTGDGSPDAPYATLNKAFTEAAAAGFLGAADEHFTFFVSGTITETLRFFNGTASTDVITRDNYSVIGDSPDTSIITLSSTSPFMSYTIAAAATRRNVLWQDLTFENTNATASISVMHFNPDATATFDNVKFKNIRYRGRSGTGGLVNLGSTPILANDVVVFDGFILEWLSQGAAAVGFYKGVTLSSSVNNRLSFKNVKFNNFGWPGSTAAASFVGIELNNGSTWLGSMSGVRGNVTMSVTNQSAVSSAGIVANTPSTTALPGYVVEDVYLVFTIASTANTVSFWGTGSNASSDFRYENGPVLRDAYIVVKRTISSATGLLPCVAAVVDRYSGDVYGEVQLTTLGAVTAVASQGVMFAGVYVQDDTSTPSSGAITGKLLLTLGAGFKSTIDTTNDIAPCAGVIVHRRCKANHINAYLHITGTSGTVRYVNAFAIRDEANVIADVVVSHLNAYITHDGTMTLDTLRIAPFGICNGGGGVGAGTIRIGSGSLCFSAPSAGTLGAAMRSALGTANTVTVPASSIAFRGCAAATSSVTVSNSAAATL